MLKILQARLQHYVNPDIPDVQAGFRKGRENRDQIANIFWIIKKQESSKKHLFLLYWLCQSLWLCRSQQTGKFFKTWEYQTTWPPSWETYMQVRKQQLELDMEHCQEPPQEIQPMTKVMRKRPDRQRRIRLQGTPLNLLEHLPPNQNLSVLLFCAFHQLFWH